ncbi:MAG: hypothetical protein LBQ81_03800 [Zoogloeaceae bacterium]|jgi:hypothetical protein|nr:hypothetical protein [Zoogloeaceae bacterium]
MDISTIATYAGLANFQTRIPASGSTTPVKTAEAVVQSSTVVSLGSGYDVMLSRLFHVDSRADEPPVEYNRDLPSGSVYRFLSMNDRKQIARIYEYALDKGIDLEKVDMLAFKLGSYRDISDRRGADNYIFSYNPQTGQLNVPEFSPENEAIALRILTSKAINNTTVLDHGFLQDILTPGRLGSASRPTAEFEFLQEIVFAFSSSGEEADPNANVPLRPKDLAEMKLAQFRSQGWDSSTTTPWEFELRQQAIARGENPDGGFFGKYQNRMNGYMAFFTDNDKSIIGKAYEMASGNDMDMKRIDKLTAELGALRLQQQLTGELIRSTTNREADKTHEVDTAHLAILGEMRRMSAAGAASV